MSARDVPADVELCSGAAAKASRAFAGDGLFRDIVWLVFGLETSRRLSPALFFLGCIVLTLLVAWAVVVPKLVSWITGWCLWTWRR